MRSLIFAIAGALVSFSACGTTDPAPSLTITPSGSPLQITGPTGLSAVLVNTSAEVTWTASSGSLSSDKGLHVVFTPPPGAGTASVTAKAGDLMASVDIAMAPPTLTGKNIPGLTAPVTVQYDAQDIPHIGCAALVLIEPILRAVWRRNLATLKRQVEAQTTTGPGRLPRP